MNCPVCNHEVNPDGRCKNTSCSAYSHKVVEIIEEEEEVVCDTCYGEGWTWTMRCFGDSPVECKINCPDCDDGEYWDDIDYYMDFE